MSRVRCPMPSFLVLLVLVLLAATAALPAAAAPPAGTAVQAALPAAGLAAAEDEAAEEEARQEGAEGEDAEEGEGEEKGEEEKWDVESPPGQPTSEVALDVDEGTWISLDVSPDGKEIVFDLLGDLYTLPIEGGEAKSLTSGLSWDMQPRYSPDGRSIAFTSDRGGGDNIWVIGRDGSDPRQVTKEDFRLLNSPVWSPDGEFIAARKHFVSARSLGAGEIWLYHRSGGTGLQLTKRSNDQKDLGEPALSPDGRYLYYSQDTTPGPFFQYNKDPNTQIYVIQRLDREEGRTEAYVTGPGGAIRPTPSPDGESLAFVRRVRGKSVLYLHDIASGAERALYDGLDRDMQEGWAIHGVYPAMAWTPDSRALVVWAGGKIRRVDAASGEATVIPFRVRDRRTLLEPLRFAQEVAPERFHTKMLRWVTVSPDGGRVVFQALGKLWVRELPDGTPRRLTRQDEHFEHDPAFSRDGRSIVYTTWSDDELGAVRVVAAAGGEGRRLTTEPGHYAEPVFSPDGAKIVFRRLEGDLLRSPLWGKEPGLYAVPASGGEPTLVTRDGYEPQFGADPERVFFVAIDRPEDPIPPADQDQRLLKSIELDGSDERTHLVSENATDLAISPDGKWVAFTEGFHAYIAPLVATGRKVEIGPDTKSIPVARVSRDTGDYLHFSGDSKALHFAQGPELFTRRLEEAFDFLEGAPEELPEPPESGIDIGFDAVTDRPAGTVAFVGGRVITMRGDEVLDDGVVVVEGDRIRAVGTRGEVAVPAGAHVVDAAGKTVIPGLIDAHWHGALGSEEIIPHQNWFLFSSLGFGVTTIHDPSNDTSEVFAAAEMQRAGILAGPRVYSTGTILYGALAPIRAKIESLDDARSHLRRMKAVGAISVKSYNQPRRDQRQQVIVAARELEMMVVPEGGSLYQHNMTMVADGHTGIEHSLPVGAIYDDVRQFWGATEVGYTPTLGVSYGGLSGEYYWYAKTDVWANERLLAFVPREIVDPRARRRTIVPEEEWGHIANAQVAKELTDAGVKVNIGAHGQREGLAAHWEMWMFEQGGMTPHEALRTATINGAWYLGLDGDLGSLEPGKLADVIVIDGNPLEDIRTTEKVLYTMVGGRLYDAATMHQLAPEERERQPFWWER